MSEIKVVPAVYGTWALKMGDGEDCYRENGIPILFTTESAALAKKAELERDAATIQHERDEEEYARHMGTLTPTAGMTQASASLPVQTRPPAPYCQCATPICAWRLGAIRCDRCMLPVSKLTVPAAAELVEQAPRPQAIECINCGDAICEDKMITLSGQSQGQDYSVEMMGIKCPKCGWQTISGPDMEKFGKLIKEQISSRAASSPVVRTQPTPLEIQMKTSVCTRCLNNPCRCHIHNDDEAAASVAVEPRRTQLELFNNHGLFEFRGIDCPYCHQPIALWAERFKGSATRIMHVRHVENQSAKCAATVASRADMTQDYDSYCDQCGAGHHCAIRREAIHWQWCEGDPSPSCWEGDKAADEGQFKLTSVVADVTCGDCKSHLEFTKNLREAAGK